MTRSTSGVRLGILAALIGLTRADFAHLKRQLALTDGNLGRHLEVLRLAGFVKLTREATGGRPRTWVSITPRGKKALRKEIDALRKIVSQIEGADVHGPEDWLPATKVGEPHAERPAKS